MNYFEGFSIIWGAIMIVIRAFIHIIPEKWNHFELEKVYKHKRPKWIWIVCLVSILIVSFTWYKELTTNVPYSLIITTLISLTLIKISQLIFNYQNFRAFVRKALVEDRSIIRKINLSTTIIGIILIILGVYLY